MIKYNEFDGKVNSMELEKDRSYLFGQLLAILEKVEERALYLLRKVKQMTDLPMQRKCGMCIPDVRQSLMKDSIVI